MGIGGMTVYGRIYKPEELQMNKEPAVEENLDKITWKKKKKISDVE